jgi:predicted O-linked N-acetylglucosamine transferase (SPINDLY family)/glycosyltransferase involved in cell wall biosynthesis
VTEQPLVSIGSFCKNSAATIRRSIDSVLSQSYRNIEFVIQDGASTDGTVEIIRSYNDPRIKLVSEPDSGPPEGFWKMMNRCEGELIGTCLSDEELLPGAIDKAVELFRQHPDAGAVTCDGWIADETGKITGEFNAGSFNLVDYLFGKYCPFWPGSFFRKQALLDIGLKTHDWTIECLEFEIWCRLGTRHKIKHVPVRMSKYGVHAGQLSNTRKYIQEHFDNRARVIRQMFSSSGFFGDSEIKLNGCLYNQLYLLYNHVRAYGVSEQEKFLLEAIQQLKSSIPALDRVGYQEYFNFLDGTRGRWNSASAESEVFRRIRGVWIKIALALPSSIRQRLPKREKELARKIFTILLHSVITVKASLGRLLRNGRASSEAAVSAAVELEFSPQLYHDVAMLYYARGQIDQALENWKKAEVLGDVTVDSLAVQASLISTTATHETLLEAQEQWAKRHANPIEDLPPIETVPFRNDRKIRVGYFCSFHDGESVRYMFAPVARRHDRQRFSAVAYSITPAAKDIESAFDEFKVVGAMTDRNFAELIRRDNIDILVEMSGFSPMNRFSAMASRCAPVQIAYFNHSGTCGVPNVDYVLTDAISVLADDERYYTEKVWRLDGCFLCFNYDWAELPEPSDPPSLKNGYITFGCFGSPGKVNDDIIELWARLLRRVPGSRFYLRNSGLASEANREFMYERFGRHGIEKGRLRLGGAESWNTFIKSYDDVDVSLDTWPYCGANTIGESFWQGVPVVTLTGNRFSTRYGSSSVMAAGCKELVAETPERYVEIAAEIALDPERIRFYRRNLRRMAREHGLSDPERFARKLEQAYTQMVNLLPGNAS